MASTKEFRLKTYLLVLEITVSLILYIIVINDWFVIYEIFFDIPLFLTLIGSVGLFILLIYEILQKRMLPKAIPTLIFILIAAIYFTIYAKRNGLFWEEKLEAAFIDDMSRMDLTLFENGNYIIYSNWLFGEERYEGRYKIEGDTIVFLNTPVTDNDFINNKSIISYRENKIYFYKRENGNYDKDFYYFQIDF